MFFSNNIFSVGNVGIVVTNSPGAQVIVASQVGNSVGFGGGFGGGSFAYSSTASFDLRGFPGM